MNRLVEASDTRLISSLADPTCRISQLYPISGMPPHFVLHMSYPTSGESMPAGQFRYELVPMQWVSPQDSY